MNKDEILFSVIVPVYNTEQYLRECLDSIVYQVEKINRQCEVILIDDGSTDSSRSICDEYNEKFREFVKVFHKQNEGSFEARKYGLNCATGKYILYCDSDDFWEDDMLLNIKKVIEHYDYPDVLIFNFNAYKNGKKEIAFADVFPEGYIERKQILEEYMSGYSIVSMCIKVCKRSCMSSCANYNPQFGHIKHGDDSLQTLEIIDTANTFFYINKALYNYRIGSGMTSRYDAEYYPQLKIVLQQILRRKSQWQLDNFELYFTDKFMNIIGRSITQSRFNTWSSMQEQIDYLQGLRNDDLIEKYVDSYADVKDRLQLSYKVIIPLFAKRKYKTICLVLNAYNAIIKRKGMEVS